MNNVEGSLQVAESIPVRQEVLKLAEESGLEAAIGNDILELIVDRKEKETRELVNLTWHLNTQKEEENKDEPEGVSKLIKTDTFKQFLANANFPIQRCC